MATDRDHPALNGYRAMQVFTIVALGYLASTWNQALAQRGERIPDATLEVGVRQQYDGKTDPGVIILRLDCFKQRCTLTSVTINQCRSLGLGGGEAFAPKIERASTDEGNLTVRSVGTAFEVEERSSSLTGDGFTKYRFQYMPDKNLVTHLVGFTGGYVKDSSAILGLGRVLASEYIPLPKSVNLIPLKCTSVIVRGVGNQ